MAVSNRRLIPETMKSLAFGSIGASYVAIGTLSFPARLLIIQNLTDKNMFFSFDGINDHLVLSATDRVILDITGNSAFNENFSIGKGTKIYVKQGAAPTTGSVYISSFHAAE